MGPENWFDLLLNLFSEVWGILATVVLVDMILKRREAARWKPSKNFVYTKLIEIISTVLTDILPTYVQQDAKYVMYQFGEVLSFPTLDVSKINLSDKQSLSQLYAGLGGISIGRWIERKNSLIEVQKKLDGVIDDSAFFLDPEVLALLFAFRNDIEKFIVHTSQFSESASEGYLSENLYYPFANTIHYLLTSALAVQMWLVKHSVKTVSQAEYKESMKRDLRKRLGIPIPKKS